ncbi:Hypothetical predicted protein [Octopus vulgaris]|uniref:Uncharacterized protein n=1 Tax=Octopus vulgaris TaxID=6645 RepID=A0AA36FPL9_OCTVU|nr:Hypothetical predicted protein [Octopus vulgaris]
MCHRHRCQTRLANGHARMVFFYVPPTQVPDEAGERPRSDGFFYVPLTQVPDEAGERPRSDGVFYVPPTQVPDEAGERPRSDGVCYMPPAIIIVIIILSTVGRRPDIWWVGASS